MVEGAFGGLNCVGTERSLVERRVPRHAQNFVAVLALRDSIDFAQRGPCSALNDRSGRPCWPAELRGGSRVREDARCFCRCSRRALRHGSSSRPGAPPTIAEDIRTGCPDHAVRFALNNSSESGERDGIPNTCEYQHRCAYGVGIDPSDSPRAPRPSPQRHAVTHRVKLSPIRPNWKARISFASSLPANVPRLGAARRQPLRCRYSASGLAGRSENGGCSG